MTEPRVLSDDDLEHLLRASFAAHEPLADAETAHRLATTPPPPRRVWPAVVGVAAGVALIVGVGIGVARGHTSSPAVLHGARGVTSNEAAPGSAPTAAPVPGLINGIAGPDAGPDPATDAEALAATKREARGLLQAFGSVVAQAAPGVRRQATSPTSALRPMEFYIGPSDTSLTLTGWWAVQLSPGDLKTYLDSHPVRGQKPTGWGASTGPRHSALFPDTSYEWASTSAYTTPFLAVTLQPAGTATYVRVDTFIAARHVRPTDTRVEGTVSSVVVGGVGASVTVTDVDTVNQFRLAFDGLPGSPTVPWVGSCPGPVGGSDPTLRLTFHTSDGDLVVHDVSSSGCGPDTVTILRNGAPVTPTLDGGTGDTSFRQQVAEILGTQP